MTKPLLFLYMVTGLGPDTPFVIAPLREFFGELNYTTLSLQMPVLGDVDRSVNLSMYCCKRSSKVMYRPVVYFNMLVNNARCISYIGLQRHPSQYCRSKAIPCIPTRISISKGRASQLNRLRSNPRYECESLR